MNSPVDQSAESGCELLPRIKQLIADQIGYPVERMTLDTRLRADIGMAGDDGYDFLKRFQDEFAVDMASLRYNQHFESEGAISTTSGIAFAIIVLTSALSLWFIPVWAVGLFLYFLRSRRSEVPGEIRVSDLLRSAEQHSWSYNYPNAINRNA